jgi:uncharacterized membrane protein YbhN (UPF0104 family)
MTFGGKGRAWKLVLLTLGWAALIYFLVRSLNRLPSLDEWGRFLHGDAISAGLVFGACFLVCTALRTFRFGYLLRLSSPVPWREITLAFPWLFMIGAITPLRLGEGLRAVWIRQHGGASIDAIGYWFAERWTDLIMLAAFALIGIVAAPAVAGLGLWAWLVAGSMIAGYFVLWLVARPVLGRLGEKLPVGADLSGRFLNALRYMDSPKVHGAVVGLTVAIWLILAFGFWVVLNAAFGGGVSFAVALGCVAAVNLSAFLSVAPANLGSFQAAMIAMLALYGFGPETGFMAAVLIQGIGLVVTLVTGSVARVIIAMRSWRKA